VSKKPVVKRMKAGLGQATPSKTAPPPSKPGPARKISVMKIARPKAKPGPPSTSKIELVLAKPIGVSKKFHPLDVTAPSYGINVGDLIVIHVERATRQPSTISVMTRC
jgi:hypothetical protein